jgi:hypothetical protein
VPTNVTDLDYAQNSGDIFQDSIVYNEKMYSVQVTRSPSPPPSPSCPVAESLHQAEGGNTNPRSDRLDVHKLTESDTEENNGGSSEVDRDELPKSLQKARLLSEHRENKFTSTLRRLSTVRKRNKMKRKEARDRYDEHDDSSVEASAAVQQPPNSTHIPEVMRRGSSTTSRDSEIEALTSGYFR